MYYSMEEHPYNSLAPVLPDPGRRQHMFVKHMPIRAARPRADQRVIRIRLACERDNPCISRQVWDLEEIQRPARQKGMLETQAPFRRPELHVGDGIGNILLFNPPTP